MYQHEEYAQQKARALKANPSPETLADIRVHSSNVAYEERCESADVANSAQPEIRRELQDLEKAPHLFHEAISRLEKRLAPILFNAPESGEKMAARPRDTELGNFIGARNDELFAALRHLESISKRIAL